METSSAYDIPVRLLGLGNELLADDGFGIRVAREAAVAFGAALQVVTSAASGFHLLDDVLGARRLLVVDTVETGAVPPGTLRVWREEEMRPAAGGSPHFIGLFEVVESARALRLAAPEELVVVGMEASDCTTVGGPMQPEVEAGIPAAVALIGRLIGAFPAREGAP